jgi:hypothetical protein
VERRNRDEMAKVMDKMQSHREEEYKEAVKKGSSCLPAELHLLVITKFPDGCSNER